MVFGDASRGGGYTQFDEWHGDHIATLGVVVHELGHDLGLPDLYDTDGSSEGVGEWSIMGSGGWLTLDWSRQGSMPSLPDAWSKSYEGWLAPRRVPGPQVATTIPQIETGASAIQLVRNPNGFDWTYQKSSGTGEYFLLENRQRVGYDAALPGAGLLVRHIDETRSYTNTANANEARKLVDLEEADGYRDLDVSYNRGDEGDPFYGTSDPYGTPNTPFNAASNPNSRLYDGASSGVTVANISGSSSSMSATISAP